MNKTFQKLQKMFSITTLSILSLLFTKIIKAHVVPKYGPAPEYGPAPIPPMPMYGMPDGYLEPVRNPLQTLFSFLPYIVGTFIIFVIAPIIGLIWYKKRGGKKKWPSVIVKISVLFFVLALVALIIFVYCRFYSLIKQPG